MQARKHGSEVLGRLYQAQFGNNATSDEIQTLAEISAPHHPRRHWVCVSTVHDNYSVPACIPACLLETGIDNIFTYYLLCLPRYS